MATLNDLFYNKYESLASNHTEFVAKAYEDLLGYDVDNMKNADARIGYWVDRIENGLSRDDFAGTFVSESDGGESQWVSDADLEKNAASKAAVLELDFDVPDLDLSEVSKAVQEAHGGAGNGDTGNGDTGNGDTIESSGTFTLTEIPSQTETTLQWDGVEADAALSFLQSVNDLNLEDLGVELGEDGRPVNIENVNIQDDLDVDGDGSSVVIGLTNGEESVANIDTPAALFAQIIRDNLTEQETVTQTGIVLTPEQNNGGAFESGTPSAENDTIVAGRPELLHGAYIDGGGGYNTLEVDMKGVFAQPFQLKNIQIVKVQNLPNVYAADQTFLTEEDGSGFVESNFPQSTLLANGNVASSYLDLSRAGEIEKVVINEGSFPQGGGLAIAGIQNYATARLEGSFDHSVDLHYGQGQGDELSIELANVSFDTTTFSVSQNAGAVNLLSEGRINTLDNVDFGDNLRELKITGEGELSIEDDLGFGFGEATIDASENTGGVRLDVASQDNTAPLSEINITGSQGDDVLTITGGVDAFSLLNIDTGAGQDTVQFDSAVSAGSGSVLTGEDLTVAVNANTDLRNADVSGVNTFSLAAGGSLLLTQNQVQARDISTFQAADNSEPVLSIEVSEAGTTLSDLVDLDALDDDVNLAFNVLQDADLTLTAEQLHKYVVVSGIAGEGIGAGDGNEAVVNILDAGVQFNPNDVQSTGGGTLGAFGGQVNVVRSEDGFTRPVPGPNTDILTITADGDEATVVPENALDNPAINDNQISTLLIEGTQDVVFEGRVDLAQGFTLNFSQLEGDVQNLTLENFQDITPNAGSNQAAVNNGNPGNIDVSGEGQIIGNGSGRINLSLSGQVGFDDNAVGGFNTQGVPTYVVTDLNGVDWEIFLSDSSQDIETIGLQGNSGDDTTPGTTLTVTNIPFGAVNPTILFEGDGAGNWDELSKAAGNPNESNVGTIEATYFRDGAQSNILITNQGQEPGETQDGGPRPIVVDGITLDNAISADITVEDGNSVISDLTDSGNGSGLEDVTLSSANDVTLTLDSANSGLNINADGVNGLAQLWIDDSNDDDVDLSGGDLSGIESIVLDETADGNQGLTLTLDQIQDIGVGNITRADGGDNVTLNVGQYDGTEFDFGALDASGIGVGSVTMIAGATVEVAAGTDFTGVDSLIVPTNTSATISAAQFQQLVAEGSTIGGGGSLTVDMDGDLTIGSDAESTIAGANVTFDAADGETLNVETFSLADGLRVSGDAEADTTPLVNLTFEDNGTTPFSATIGVAGYQDVDTRIQDELLDRFYIDANNNGSVDTGENSQSIEDLLTGLEDASILNIYQQAAEDPDLDPRDREVVVEPEAEPDGIEFSSQGTNADLLRSVDLTLEADAGSNAVVAGDVTVNDGEFREDFDMLTINTANLDGNATGPVTINGSVLSSSAGNVAGAQGDLSNVTINTDGVALDITGELRLRSDDTDINDATLTLTGDSDVTVKEVISGTNITNVTVDTTDYTGNFQATGGSPALSGDVETLTFDGTGDVTIGTPDVAVEEDSLADDGNVYAWGAYNTNNLHTINASGQSGALTMALGDIATNDDGAFNFTAGSGETTLWLSDVLKDTASFNENGELTDEGTVAAPNQGNGEAWNIDLSNAAADSVVRLSDAVTFGGAVGTDNASVDVNLGDNGELQLDGNVVFPDGNNLSVSGGSVTIDGHVDFTGLQQVDGDDIVTNLDLGGATVTVEEGATVRMTDEQFAAFTDAGGTIEGVGTDLLLDADAADALTNGVDVDLTTVRGLTSVDLVTSDEELSAGDSRHVGTNLTMTPDQAAVTTQQFYNSDGELETLRVDDDGDQDLTDGDDAEAGDFRAFGPNVTVELDDADDGVDVTDLQGVSIFDIVADDPIDATVGFDQLGDVVVEGANTSTAAEIIEEVGDLTVYGEVDSGNTNTDGDPIFEQQAYTISVSRNEDGDVITSVDITGNATALAEGTGGIGAAGSGYATEADTVTWQAVGTTATATETGDLNAEDSAATIHTFEWIANADTDDGGTSITGFMAGDVNETNYGDVLDFSAFLGDGYTAVNDGTNPAANGDTETGLAGSVGFIDQETLGAEDFGDGSGTPAENFADIDGQAVVLGDADGDAVDIWYVDSDAGAGTDGTVDDPGDIQLVGTVDTSFANLIDANVGA